MTENNSVDVVKDRNIDALSRLINFGKRIGTSPTTVWFASLWVFATLAMIVFNIARVGFNIEGIFGGPAHYADLFLSYGLNSEGSYNTPWDNGILAWIIAPFLAIWIGLPLYFLRDSGYAFNGNTREMDPLLPSGDPFYAFFSKEVFGANVLIFGMKGNLFYIGIVWLPIIAAAITTVIYARRTRKPISLPYRFLFSFIIGLWVGIQMAKITDPELSFSFKGFFESLFLYRRENRFVIYEGEYHPTMLASLATLFQIVPMIVVGLVGGSITAYKRTRLEWKVRQEQLAYQKERATLAGIEELPWESGERDKTAAKNGKILDVQNLYTYFRTESGVVKALDGVSFDVGEKESVGVVGESGCGKTVTAQSILQILPKNGEIVEGEINYRGVDTLRLTKSQMRKVRGKQIALLFQDPLSALNPVMTIKEQMVDVILLHRDVEEEEAVTIAVDMMKAVGIPEAENRIYDYPHQFSGGMRQRVLIARALTLDPKLLIADEPTTALDVTIQAQVLKIIKDIQDEFGLSLMLITHNLGVVRENTNRIHIFYGGRVVESGQTSEIFRDPKHPYTQALLQSIPSFKSGKERLATIPGVVPQLINPPQGCRFHPRCSYATEKCKTRPPLEKAADGRSVACFYWREIEAGTKEITNIFDD